MKKRQVIAYNEFRVKIHHEDGLEEGDSPTQNLSYVVNYVQAKFESDPCILG